MNKILFACERDVNLGIINFPVNIYINHIIIYINLIFLLVKGVFETERGELC